MAHTLIPCMNNGKRVFALVFHGDSLGRITSHDPAVVQGSDIMRSVLGREQLLSQTDFIVCYERDHDEFHRKCKELKDPQAVLGYLCRNWENREREDMPMRVVDRS